MAAAREWHKRHCGNLGLEVFATLWGQTIPLDIFDPPGYPLERLIGLPLPGSSVPRS
jgi:hypothetical protein